LVVPRSVSIIVLNLAVALIALLLTGLAFAARRYKEGFI